MFIKINDREYQLLFNIGFIRRLDGIHRASLKDDNLEMSFGIGLISAKAELSMGNPAMLSDVMWCATTGISQDSVDKYIEDYAEANGDLSKLFKQVESEMGKSPVVKATVQTQNKIKR